MASLSPDEESRSSHHMSPYEIKTNHQKKKEESIRNFVDRYKMRIKIAITLVVMVLSILSITSNSIVASNLPFPVSGDNGHRFALLSIILSLIVSSSVVVKQVFLQYLDNLRTVHNKIRGEINRFMEENNILHNTVNDLSIQVNRLKPIEDAFSNVIGDSVEDAETLNIAIRENARIVEELSKLSTMQFHEELIKTVLKRDRDQDLRIGDRETKALFARLRSMKGVDVDENGLKDLLEKSDGSLGTIIAFIKGEQLEVDAGFMA